MGTLNSQSAVNPTQAFNLANNDNRDNKGVSCLVWNGKSYQLTDRQGDLVEGPTWTQLPMLYSSIFFMYGKEIWCIDGKRVDTLVGDLVWFSNFWVCQKVQGDVYLGKMSPFYNWKIVNNIRIDKLGYCDHDWVIVKRDGNWAKLMYCNGYNAIDNWNPGLVTKSELIRMQQTGCDSEFYDLALSSNLLRSTIVGDRLDWEDACVKLAANGFDTVMLAMRNKMSPEVLSARTGISLSEASAILDAVGSVRTQFSD